MLILTGCTFNRPSEAPTEGSNYRSNPKRMAEHISWIDMLRASLPGKCQRTSGTVGYIFSGGIECYWKGAFISKKKMSYNIDGYTKRIRRIAATDDKWKYIVARHFRNSLQNIDAEIIVLQDKCPALINDN
jgi:hypothetical protein